jgi:hypothetical protein
MDEYKEKVKENGTIFGGIKTDNQGAGLLFVAFPCAAKTL